RPRRDDQGPVARTFHVDEEAVLARRNRLAAHDERRLRVEPRRYVRAGAPDGRRPPVAEREIDERLAVVGARPEHVTPAQRWPPVRDLEPLAADVALPANGERRP